MAVIHRGERMVTISVCMIVKNEDKVIRRCLSCVKSFADEIIVVDTGSNDQTIKISREMGAYVYQIPWKDDFASARNYAFTKATKDYQFWLDADDVIDEADQKKIIELKKELDPAVDVVMMRYEMMHASEETPIIFERERLLRRDQRFQWEGRVHETILPCGCIVHSDITIKHRKEHINDPMRNLRIFESMEKEGTLSVPRDQFYYARELREHGRIKKAIVYYEEFLKQDGWIEDRLQACYELGICYLLLKDRKQAFYAYTRSFQYARPVSRICNAIGYWLLEEKRYDEAAYWYEQSIRSTHQGGFENKDEHDFLPGLQLAICYYYLDQKEIAANWFQFAKSIHPKHEWIKQNQHYFE